jgi:hypothetical protein
MTLVTSAVLLGGDAEYRRTDTSTNEPKVVAVFKSEINKSSNERSKRTEVSTNKPEVATLSKPESSKSSNERYIRSIAEKMPSYQRAKSEGIIDDIMYEPSEKEIEERIRKSIMASGRVPKDRIITDALKIYKLSKINQDAGMATMPAPKKNLPLVKRTIVVFETALIAETVKSKRELQNLIEHELQHAEDLYNGFEVMEPLASRISEADWDWVLWHHIIELRAMHRQFNDIFGKDVSAEGALFSKGWLALQSRRYYRIWSFMKKYTPATEIWASIRNSQLDAVKDILPERNGLTITTTRSGKKDAIVITYENLSQILDGGYL